MIEVKQVPLPTSETKQFNLWLDRGESTTLFKLIESKVKENQVKGSEDGLKASSFNSFNVGAIDHFIKAQRYQTALDVLKEIFSEQDHYTVTLT